MPQSLRAPGDDWPSGLDPRTICLTVDVEWAAPVVLDDLRGLFDQHGVKATFFVTHAGVKVPGHERGLHPNFRRNGDTYRALLARHGGSVERLGEADIFQHVVATTKSFAPEAKGVRAHSLFYESTLMPVYRAHGIEYECSYQMALVPNLRPFAKGSGLIGMATYYGDHGDITEGMTGFDVARLHLDRPGLKVFDFHPNIVFLNAGADAQYQATRTFYHDADRLRAARHAGKGVRTLLLELLNAIARHRLPTATAGEVAAAWRGVAPWS